MILCHGFTLRVRCNIETCKYINPYHFMTRLLLSYSTKSLHASLDLFFPTLPMLYYLKSQLFQARLAWIRPFSKFQPNYCRRQS